MSKLFYKTFLLLLILVITFISVGVVLASYDKFAPGEEITISEFIYNDDFTPYTSNCTLSVYKPNGDAFTLPGGATMSKDDTTGRHYKTFTPDGAPGSTEGVWPANISCGTAGVDKSILDKTFLVGYSGAISPTDQTSLASSIWGYTGAALDTASNAVSKVWSFTGRSLDTVANISSGVWGAGSRLLTGGGLVTGNMVTETYLDTSLGTAVADIATIKGNVATLITQIGTGNISAIKTATDTIVWGDVTGIVTTSGQIKAKTDTIDWANVTGIKTKTDTIAWGDVTGIKTKTDTIDWTDVTSIKTSQQAGWTVTMSDFGQTSTGNVYRATLQILNYQSQPTDPAVAPVWALYDGNHAAINPINYVVIKDSIGKYHVTYTVDAAIVGMCETQILVEVEAGKIITVNDYWEVEASPPHVSVNEITDKSIPEVSGNVTIINEGLHWYEYHYEWCVVSNVNHTCTGSNPVYGYGSSSERINSGESFNTNLTSDNVPSVGVYYFKVLVYYGTEKSGASKEFTAENSPIPPTCGDNSCNGTETCSTCSNDCGVCLGGGGGGGGSGGSIILPTCNGADFNYDKKVNSTDFSILLAFWKTNPPFKNSCVDINKDGKVNSIDFSILMYQWGTKR